MDHAPPTNPTSECSAVPNSSSTASAGGAVVFHGDDRAAPYKR